MNQAIDITALQEMIGGTPVQYHEIVRNEKAIQCVARWPLLAQIQGGSAVAAAGTAMLAATGIPPVRHADLTMAAVMAAPAAALATPFTSAFAPAFSQVSAPVPTPVAEQVPAFAPWGAAVPQRPQATVMAERAQERAPAAAVPVQKPQLAALDARPVKSNQLLSLFKRLELPTVADNDFAH